MSLYDTGILMTSGFSIASQKPADLKFLADTIQDRDLYVTNNLAYEGMIVYVKEDEITYQYKKDGTWKEFGFNTEQFKKGIADNLSSDSSDLALSAKQGNLLNQKITSHTNNTEVHITKEEREAWNNKASSSIATQSSDGLMSYLDKKKLDELINYNHPVTHPATMIEEDETHRFVSDEEKQYWNNKANVTIVTHAIDGLMSAADKIKLDSINIEDGSVSLDEISQRLADIEQRLIDIESKLLTAVYFK